MRSSHFRPRARIRTWEVEQFWRVVDGDSSSFTRFPHPHAVDPGFALEFGRVHAEVRELGGSDEGVRVVIDDGTGHLDVWCPSAVTMFGPTCPGRFELELVTTAGAPHVALAEALAVRRVAEEA